MGDVPGAAWTPQMANDILSQQSSEESTALECYNKDGGGGIN